MRRAISAELARTGLSWMPYFFLKASVRRSTSGSMICEVYQTTSPSFLAASMSSGVAARDAAEKLDWGTVVRSLEDVLLEAAQLGGDPLKATPGFVRDLVAEVRAHGDAARGAQVFRRPDLNCLSCHAVDKKVVGPSYKDVAKKYAADAGAADKLATKIKKGGSGVWGPIPMPPASMLSDAEAATLAKYVLSLK